MPAPDQPAKKIRFDGTINLGHIISAITVLMGIMAGWAMMDKRVVVLEEARLMQAQIDKRQDETLSDMRRMMREDMRDVNNKLDRLLDRRK
jgi:hypothetical protein